MYVPSARAEQTNWNCGTARQGQVPVNGMSLALKRIYTVFINKARYLYPSWSVTLEPDMTLNVLPLSLYRVLTQTVILVYSEPCSLGDGRPLGALKAPSLIHRFCLKVCLQDVCAAATCASPCAFSRFLAPLHGVCGGHVRAPVLLFMTLFSCYTFITAHSEDSNER